MIVNDNRCIYLVGMMGSGKTALGSVLASLIDYDFIDLDKYIEAHCGMSIPDIFDKEGEVAFRSIELQLLREINNPYNVIIATGGGTVIYHDNMNYMKQIGTTIWVRVAISQMIARIKGDASRPIAANKTYRELRELYAKRRPYYSQAHYTVWNRGDLYAVANKIAKKMNVSVSR